MRKMEQLMEDLFVLFELVAPSVHTCSTSAFCESVLLLITFTPDTHTHRGHQLLPNSRCVSAGHSELTDINCKSMLV